MVIIGAVTGDGMTMAGQNIVILILVLEITRVIADFPGIEITDETEVLAAEHIHLLYEKEKVEIQMLI